MHVHNRACAQSCMSIIIGTHALRMGAHHDAALGASEPWICCQLDLLPIKRPPWTGVGLRSDRAEAKAKDDAKDEGEREG